MRAHMADVLEFLSDVHTLSKVKSSVKANAAAAKPGSGGGGGGGGAGIATAASGATAPASSGAVGVGLNEDTLGGILKASLSQYLALEIAKGNGKDSRYDVRSWRLCGRSVLTSPHCLALEVPQSRAISYY